MDKKEVREFLLKYSCLKPESQIDDYIKVLYQSFFGAKHLINHKSHSLLAIKEELLKANSGEIEDLLNGYVRYPLCMIKDPEKFNEVFLSQLETEVDEKGFVESLNILKELIEQGTINADINMLIEYMTLESFPPISHSEQYRKKYDPHYRVIQKSLINKL